MTPDHYDALVAGSYFCDMVFTGLPEVPKLGRDIFSRGFAVVPGGSYYIVVTLHRLRVKVGWMGHVGTDLFSGFVEQAIAAEGIDTGLLQRHDYPVRRVAASFSFEEDRGFVSYVDPLDETIPLDVIARTRPRCVILHGLHYWEQIDAIQQLANRAEFKLVLDSQDTRLTLNTPGLVDRLRAVDVFVPNESEALAVSGEPTAERALARLAEIVPLVVIKRGRQGSIAQQGCEVVQVPALRVQVVDTTGAGDCFNAGLMFGLLRGDPLDLCLRYGNITGGLSTTAPGAQAVPLLDTVLAMAGDYARYAG